MSKTTKTLKKTNLKLKKEYINTKLYEICDTLYMLRGDIAVIKKKLEKLEEKIIDSIKENESMEEN